MSEELETTLTPNDGIDVDKSDAIADLLLAEDDDIETTSQDDQGTEESPETSTEEAAEIESNQEGDDEDITWAGTLGIGDEQIVLDEEGDLQGFNVNVGGETDTVDLKELITGYQYNKYNTQNGQELAEERKTFEVAREGAVQEYSKRLQDLDKLTNYMQSSLMREFQGINWEQLRVTDPAEYAAMMQDYNTRQQEIQGVYSAISQEQTQAQQHKDTLAQEGSSKRLQGEIDKAIKNNPEWANKDKFMADYQELGNFVTSNYGISTEEYNGVQDARFLELVKDAQKYRQGLKVAGKKLKKPVPKFQGGGGKRKSNVTRLDKLTRASKKAKGTEKRALQQSAISELLMENL